MSVVEVLEQLGGVASRAELVRCCGRRSFDRATAPSRTLLDCLRNLPALDALAVADSALRSGFSRSELLAVAREARGPGSGQAREVAHLATPLAANPFESGLRGIAARVDGLTVRPQVPVHDPGFLGRPDLVDERLRIAFEADSFQWHGGRAALTADARRYNALVVHGWLVLRFCWEDVMCRPDEVEATLRAVVEVRTDQLCVSCRARVMPTRLSAIGPLSYERRYITWVSASACVKPSPE